MSTNTRSGIYTVLFLIAFVAVITFFAFIYPNMKTNGPNVEGTFVNEELYDLAGVDSVVYSETDGSEHNVSVKFTLAVDENYHGSLDRGTLENHITDVISGLDYDKIISEDGIDYIKTEVAESLAGYISQEDFNGIYIRGIVSDDMPFPDYDELRETQEKRGVTSQEKIFEGLRRRD